MYKVKDNAEAQLQFGISSVATTLVVKEGQGASFPEVPFLAVLNKRNSDGEITKSEKVEVSAVSGDQFTISRGYEGTTPSDFSADDFVSLFVLAKHIEELQTEVVKKANQTEVESVAQRTDSLEEKITTAEGKISQLVANGRQSNLTVKLTPGEPIGSVNNTALIEYVPYEVLEGGTREKDTRFFQQEFSYIPSRKIKNKAYMAFKVHNQSDIVATYTITFGKASYSNFTQTYFTKEVSVPAGYLGFVYVEVEHEKIPFRLGYDRHSFRITPTNNANCLIYLANQESGLSISLYKGTQSNSSYYNKSVYVEFLTEYDLPEKFITPIGLGTEKDPQKVYVNETNPIGVSLEKNTTGHSNICSSFLVKKYNHKYSTEQAIGVKFHNPKARRIKQIQWFPTVDNWNGTGTISIYRPDSSGNLDSAQLVKSITVEKKQLPQMRYFKGSGSESDYLQFPVIATDEETFIHYIAKPTTSVSNTNYLTIKHGNKNHYTGIKKGNISGSMLLPSGSIEITVNRHYCSELIIGTGKQELYGVDFDCELPVGDYFLTFSEGIGAFHMDSIFQEFYSGNSVNGLTKKNGKIPVDIVFHDEDIEPIEVVLNGGVVEIPDAEFKVGETYYCFGGVLNRTKGVKIGKALSKTKILLEIAGGIVNGVQTGDVPLGMPIGYVQMNGYNVPVYG